MAAPHPVGATRYQWADACVGVASWQNAVCSKRLSASALAQFTNGAQGTIEVCRVVFGGRCEMAFELHGTQGSLSWNYERMNQLNVYLPQDDSTRDGPVQFWTRLTSL